MTPIHPLRLRAALWRAYISTVRMDVDRLEVSAEAEKVERSYGMVREPLLGQPASAVSPDPLVCQSVILTHAGEAVRAGAAKVGEGGVFSRVLKGVLGPGP